MDGEIASKADEGHVQIGDLLDSIRRTARTQLITGNLPRCDYLTGEENKCMLGEHFVCVDMGEDQFPAETKTGQCPIAVKKAADARRADILSKAQPALKIAARYGITSWATDKPLWLQLWSAIDRSRQVRFAVGLPEKWRPLGELLDMIHRGCEKPSLDAPNLMLTGPCGTGKTTLQALLFLASAEAGINSAFVDSIDLRTLINGLNSRFSETAKTADKEFSQLAARDVIFWSDVGDTHATRNEFAETIATLLERFIGRLVVSTNLTSAELERHPDIGHRAVSRMLAGRHGKPAVMIHLEGKDQRRHGMSTARDVEL